MGVPRAGARSAQHLSEVNISQRFCLRRDDGSVEATPDPRLELGSFQN